MDEGSEEREHQGQEDTGEEGLVVMVAPAAGIGGSALWRPQQPWSGGAPAVTQHGVPGGHGSTRSSLGKIKTSNRLSVASLLLTFHLKIRVIIYTANELYLY